MDEIKIIVAAHKAYRMPRDPMYLPLQVGAEGKEKLGYACDDTGDHISGKNANYCELTGLYWAWKNLDAEAVGLVHYRRYFLGKGRRLLTAEEAGEILARCDIILPKKRNYWIETNYSQYVHAHNEEDLAAVKRILEARYPEYLPAWESVMRRTSGHRFNMLIMKKDKLDEYCSWLFDMLFTLEEQLDISGYSDYDKRVFGFVAERLLDVWVLTKGYPYEELPYRFMEKQNWLIKGGRFLLRKLKGSRRR